MSEEKELPRGWEFTELTTFIVKGGGTVDPSRFQDEVFELFSIPAYDSHVPEIVKGNQIGSTKKIVKENDVLLSRIVPHIQRSWIVPKHSKRRQIGSGEWIIFRGSIYIPQYMRFFHLSNDFHRKLMTTTSGVGGSLTRANPNQIARFLFPLPPLPEQQRIVAKIEDLFSSLDKGIERLKDAQAQLKIYRQAVLKWAFEGKLTNKNVKDGELPDGWKNFKLKEKCGFITKGTTPSKNKLFQHIGEVPFLKVYNLTFSGNIDFTIDPTFISFETHKNELNRSIAFPGDVLMNIVGPPLGKVSIVPTTYKEWNINQAVARFRCQETLNNKYLAYYLMSEGAISKYIDQSKATVGQVNLTLEICRNIEIPLPLVFAEQQAIVSEIESRLSVCDKLEESIEQSLLQAESLRQSILKKAFEGKLVPQDPNDEPASVLLERIRSERNTGVPEKKTRKAKEAK